MNLERQFLWYVQIQSLVRKDNDDTIATRSKRQKKKKSSYSSDDSFKPNRNEAHRI